MPWRTGCRTHPVNANNPAALREAVAASLREDQGLSALLTSVIQYSPTIFDVSIADSDNRVLLSTDAAQQDQPVPQRPNYAELRDGGLLHLVRLYLAIRGSTTFPSTLSATRSDS